MMAAYQPTPGGHPGLPHGHPGMAPQGQHMGQPMQMHAGVSGAPHVSQPGAMMGMQPGAQGMGPGGMGGQHPGMGMQGQMGGQSMASGMPGQQAMSHMTPQQAMQAQQAQQMAQMQANPQLAQQQQMMRLRQHQMMQAAQQNGMMGMQHQGMQGMTPQQIQHLQQQQAQSQQGGPQAVQLPQHLMQQQLQLHQQRQAQMAQQQQQNQMAQQLAMQHANSQQSNQGQPTPTNSQGQPNNPQQMRPQSRMANPNEQTPGGQQQQHPQQGQGQQSQPQPQPTPQPSQANPQQQGQQQMSVAQRQHLALLQRQQLAQRQQQMAQAQAQQPQAAQGGMFILRLMNFSDHLSNMNVRDGTGKELENWHSFVERHFAQDGRLIHSFIKADPNSSSGSSSRVFEVQRPTIARYFWSYFDSGAHSLRLHTEHAREVPHSSGSNQVICQNAIFSVSYPNGARLEMTGSLQVLFTAGTDSIECLQFQISSTEDIVSRSSLEKVVSDFSPSMPTKSPKMAKSKLPKAQQKMQEQQDRLTMDHFPKTPKGTLGITSKVQQFLEIGETMNVMSDLMYFAQEKKMRPEQAMEELVRQYDAQSNQQGGGNGNPQINLPPNGVQRTPSMQNMQLPQNGQQGNFSSPNIANMNLPNGMNGSPHMGKPGNLNPPNMNMPNSHTPSPHQSHMGAPAMMPQHSQQGTNSSVASANTSPNVNNNNNKRRRSTVKVEGDDGGGPDGGNSNRVKPSPQMRKKAKP